MVQVGDLLADKARPFSLSLSLKYVVEVTGSDETALDQHWVGWSGSAHSYSVMIAGDTEQPFFELARRWSLPNTSILSLRGPYQ